MKIFVSYTIRDGIITKHLLSEIRQNLSTIGETYIDLLDNTYGKNQDKIISKLTSSDLLVLIETPCINDSHWVDLEIQHAIRNKIPIIKFTVDEINGLIDEKKLNEKIMGNRVCF